jgi:hypothetical protein
MLSMARHAARRRRWPVLVGVAVLVVAGLSVAFVATRSTGPGESAGEKHTLAPTHQTSTSAAPTTTTSSTLPGPGPGFVAGHVTAVGDSVMLDYQDPLQTDIPGIDVEAAVSRQWDVGEQLLAQLKSAGQLGAEVIVALSTNGPIADTDFNAMMSILQGASRVVFVNIHVDRGWQNPNNAVLAAGVSRFKNTVLVDWNTLADQNPQWFGSDGTHLAIDGSGAVALASLITSTLSNG